MKQSLAEEADFLRLDQELLAAAEDEKEKLTAKLELVSKELKNIYAIYMLPFLHRTMKQNLAEGAEGLRSDQELLASAEDQRERLTAQLE
jgi:hypothetical protein